MTLRTPFVLFLVSLMPSPAAGAEFSHNFRNGFDPINLKLFAIGGDSPTSFCQTDSTGLRIKIPATATKLKSCGAEIRFSIPGDFEAIGRYRLVNVPEPTAGLGAGVTLSVTAGDKQWASLQRVRQKKKGEVYVAHCALTGSDGKMEHNSQVKPTTAMHGRMQLRRVGKFLQFAVADGDATEFTELREVEFTSADIVRVHFAGKTGESPTPAEIVWSDVLIRGDRVVPRGEPPSSGLRWYTVTGIIAAAVSIVATGFFLRSRM